MSEKCMLWREKGTTIRVPKRAVGDCFMSVIAEVNGSCSRYEFDGVLVLNRR